jgi:hypothetical protein
VSTSAHCKILLQPLSLPKIPFCDVRGCSLLFVAVNGKRFRHHTRSRAGFLCRESGNRCQNVPDSKQVAESEAKSVAQEKEADSKENANPGKEKKGKDVARKKEIESIADSLTKKVAIAGASFIAGGTDNTVADTTRYADPGSDRPPINFTRLHSASRG